MLRGVIGVEESPVGFAGVEQRPDPVVSESSEPEGGAFDAFDQVVDCFGGAVGDPSLMPVDDLVMPTPQRATQPGQLRWTVRVGEVVGEFTQIGAGELGAVDVIEAAQGLFGVPRQAHLALGVACGEQAAEFGVGVFAEPFMSGDQQPSHTPQRVLFAATVAQGVVLDPAALFGATESSRSRTRSSPSVFRSVLSWISIGVSVASGGWFTLLE